MAKAASKAPIKAEPKTEKKEIKTEKKKAAPKKSISSTDQIVAICQASLEKLSQLDIEHQLQSEINWCLGSFHNDNNPVGLYHMAERSLAVFKEELAKKTKGVTAKMVGDIEKALKG
jgi:hypothetical protein